jgi:hypothetical protein
MTKTIFLAVITICVVFGAFYLGLNIGLMYGSKGTFHHFNEAMRKMGYTKRQRADFFKSIHDAITAEDKEDASNAK